ncbi:MAG: hypothetical protein AMXMBFR72_11830 [Betaproteobacteria bacterium]
MARGGTLAFDALRLEGALFSPDHLEQVARQRADRQSEADYGIPRGLALRDEIGRAFRIGQALWEDFAHARARTDRAPHEAAQAFVTALLAQAFGFTDLAPAAVQEIGGRRYPIGHVARGGVPIVIAPHALDLDAPDARFADTRRRSATQLAQEFLNAESRSNWAIVSNGATLRLIADSVTLTRPAYLEADLERIFAEQRYADFSALWLTLHASRFPAPGMRGAECVLDVWRRASREQGTRARERLRDGVAEALLELGNGFLQHPANTGLRAALNDGRLSRDAYFQQLLRLVYRLIFLFTVEDRELLHPPGADRQAVRLYADGYSARRLRNRALRRAGYDRHADLWQALVIAFRSLARGEPQLALPALGGLYADAQCPDLDAAQLSNRALLAAVAQLAWFRDGAVLSRVRYRDMGPEELGSIYESLLELVPEVDLHARRFGFIGLDNAANTKGSARKLTGSYYTPDSLVQQLLKTALDPVLEARLAAQPDRPVDALLGLTIVDPACGSGHFLLAAARRVADRVALARTDGHPRPEDYRRALRDVIAHCIFGVDRNPMALELARMALWLEAYTPETPLAFVDHHLVCGDALLGLIDFSVLADGIPEAAFKPLAGDDAETVKELAQHNRAALKLFEKERRIGALSLAPTSTREALAALDAAADDTLAAVAAKEAAWRALERDAYASPLAQAADVLVAAFLLPKPEGADVPTSETLHHLLHGSLSAGDAARVQRAQAAAREARVMHWPIAFAQVMARGGFDVVLGNPPWERIKLQEEEFFASRAPSVAAAQNKAERARRIQALAQAPEGSADRRVFEDFVAAKRIAGAASAFAHTSLRFPLTGVGDVNTYALFAETAYRLMSSSGCTGLVVPTGIATDDSTKAFFEQLVSRRMLASLTSCYEIRRWFAGTDDRKPFCLLTLGRSEVSIFMFNVMDESEFALAEKRYAISGEELALLNPNTKTLPLFRSRADAELTKRIYARVPVLWQEEIKDTDGNVVQPEVNAWGLSFLRMFDMANDSGLFHGSPGPNRLPLYEAKLIHQFDHRFKSYASTPDRGEPKEREVTLDEKAAPSFAVRPRYWVDQREVLLRIARLPEMVLKALRKASSEAQVLALRLWAAGHLRADGDRARADRLLQQVVEAPAKVRNELGLKSAPLPQVADNLLREAAWPAHALEAVLAWGKSVGTNQLDQCLAMLLDDASARWLIAWRDIANTASERTTYFSFLPRVGVGHTAPLMFISDGLAALRAALVGNFNSLVLDYVARSKVGGNHLTYSYLCQFPILPPERYGAEDLGFVVPRVLELTYTAHDLKPFYDDIVADDAAFDPRSGSARGKPFNWDPARRAQLRAELDAYFARLYGLTRDELRFILDPRDVMGPDYPSETFRVLRDNELREFGEYRTRRLVLEAWDRMSSQ